MESTGAFKIAFPLHCSDAERASALAMLQDRGAKLVSTEAEVVDVVCENEKVLREVGCCLFQTRLASLATVVSVEGQAKNSAHAYPFPRTRAERKRYRG